MPNGYIPYDLPVSPGRRKEREELPPPGGAFRGSAIRHNRSENPVNEAALSVGNKIVGAIQNARAGGGEPSRALVPPPGASPDTRKTFGNHVIPGASNNENPLEGSATKDFTEQAVGDVTDSFGNLTKQHTVGGVAGGLARFSGDVAKVLPTALGGVITDAAEGAASFGRNFASGFTGSQAARAGEPPETEPAPERGKDGSTSSGPADTVVSDPAAAQSPAIEAPPEENPSLPGAYRIGTNAFAASGNEFGDAAYLASRGLPVPPGGVEKEGEQTSQLPLGSVSYGEPGDSAYALDQFRKASEIRGGGGGGSPRKQAMRMLARLPYGEIGDRVKRESMMRAAGLLLDTDSSDQEGARALIGQQLDQQNEDRKYALEEFKATKPADPVIKTITDADGVARVVRVLPDGAIEYLDPDASYNAMLAELESARETIGDEAYEQRLKELNERFGRV